MTPMVRKVGPFDSKVQALHALGRGYRPTCLTTTDEGYYVTGRLDPA